MSFAEKTEFGCRPDQLFGLWAMAPEQLEAYRARALSIDFETLARVNAAAAENSSAGSDAPYRINNNGVAVFGLSGPSSKYTTSFQNTLGGFSTLMVERALSQAAADPNARSILLHFDSAPGGTVAGSFELYDRILATRRIKPVYAHGSDQMTSAAYLFASACTSISANRNCVIGSIGVRSQLVDSSQKLERDGIKVIPIASSKYKAAGAEGTPITADQIADFQRQIDGVNAQFVSAVANGRMMSAEAINSLEARCYIGDEAKGKGLVDSIGGFDQVSQDPQAFAVGRSVVMTPASVMHSRSVGDDIDATLAMTSLGRRALAMRNPAGGDAPRNSTTQSEIDARAIERANSRLALKMSAVRR